MIIRYISAGDRLNYGDFLFALIFHEYFKDTFEIKYYGIIESDYSYFGAIPSRSYRCLVNEIDKENDVVVIGGGEVLFPTWRTLYSFINPVFYFINRNRYLNKIDKILNISKKLFYKTENEFPLTPNLQCENIYISVGGQFSSSFNTKEIDYLRNILLYSDFISVRDKRSYLSLKEHGINSAMIPDSAVLMSKIFPLRDLTKRIENNSLLDLTDKFMFLQVGNFKGPKNIEKFISDINQIAKNKKLNIICCPIGVAPGHEDHKLLRQFCRLDSRWRLVNPNNVFEIMYLIAKSEMYIGTSLHGLITAFSFNIPAIALNKDVLKSNSFIETWCSDFYIPSVDFEKLSSNVIMADYKWDANKAKLKLEYCQNLVESYFSDIQKHLENKNDKTKSR